MVMCVNDVKEHNTIYIVLHAFCTSVHSSQKFSPKENLVLVMACHTPPLKNADEIEDG